MEMLKAYSFILLMGRNTTLKELGFESTWTDNEKICFVIDMPFDRWGELYFDVYDVGKHRIQRSINLFSDDTDNSLAYEVRLANYQSLMQAMELTHDYLWGEVK